MLDVETTEDVAPTLLAREAGYRFLAVALDDPRRPAFLSLLTASSRELLREAAAILVDAPNAQPSQLGHGELSPQTLSTGAIDAALDEGVAALGAEYDRVFGYTMCRECPPFETEFCPNQEPFYRAQQMADVAGFYAAFGLSTADRPDYLPRELEFMALLLTKERLARAQFQRAGQSAAVAAEHAETCARARGSFFRDHLAWWLPSFSIGLRHKAGGGFYEAVGEFLAALLPLERMEYQVAAPALPTLPVLSGQPDEEPAACAGCVSVAPGG